MDCPRCGAVLSAYRLSEREASVCEACGYVGVATEHGGEPREVESWDAAIRRARRRLIEEEPDGSSNAEPGNDEDRSSDASGNDAGDHADADPANGRNGTDGRTGDVNPDNRDSRERDEVRENGAESGG